MSTAPPPLLPVLGCFLFDFWSNRALKNHQCLPFVFLGPPLYLMAKPNHQMRWNGPPVAPFSAPIHPFIHPSIHPFIHSQMSDYILCFCVIHMPTRPHNLTPPIHFNVYLIFVCTVLTIALFSISFWHNRGLFPCHLTWLLSVNVVTSISTENRIIK